MAEDFPQVPFIQGVPAPYLGFLGIKNGGRAPLNAGQQLAPVLELAKFYMAGQRQCLANNISGGIVVANTVLQLQRVPPNKWWVVESCFMVTQAAGATANFFIIPGVQFSQIINPAIGSPLFTQLGNAGNTAGTGGVSACRFDPGPILLGPGDFIELYCAAPAALVGAPQVFYTVHGVEVSS